MPKLERDIALTNIAKVLKGISLERGIVWTNIYKISPKVYLVIYTMIPDCLQYFMNLALRVLEIFCLQSFPMLKYTSLREGII